MCAKLEAERWRLGFGLTGPVEDAVVLFTAMVAASKSMPDMLMERRLVNILGPAADSGSGGSVPALATWGRGEGVD